MDLTNPSRNLGWENDERMSFMKRGPIDLVMALALIHHLAISNNLPFDRIAQFFQKICKSLIIEFVPKTDSQVQRLLATREDIFDMKNDTADKENENVFIHEETTDLVMALALIHHLDFKYFLINCTVFPKNLQIIEFVPKTDASETKRIQ